MPIFSTGARAGRGQHTALSTLIGDRIIGLETLVWPAAGEEIARQVAEDGIPGIPRTPDGILDMLVERQIALVRDGAPSGERYWRIAPDVLAEKIPDISLPAIRLRDEAMVSSIPILSVAGRILNEPGGDTQPDGPAASDLSSAAPTTNASRPAPHREVLPIGDEVGGSRYCLKECGRAGTWTHKPRWHPIRQRGNRAPRRSPWRTWKRQP